MLTYLYYPQDDFANEPQTNNIHENRIPTRGRLAPLEPLEHSPTDTQTKKPKKKKKKRKTNKTAPIDDEMEMASKRNTLAWGDSDVGSGSTMNGFAGSKAGLSPRRLEPLSRPIITGQLIV